MRKSKVVKKTKVSKPVASTRRLKKFTDGGIGTLKPKTALEAAKDLKINPGGVTLKPKTALEAAKDLKINPTIATAQTLEEQTASAKDLMEGLMRPPTKEVTATAPTVSTPKSVATKSPKTVSDSYKKSLQGLMDKGKSIDELVKAGYGTKQGLTNLGLTAPKKATAPKLSTPKKATAPKLSTPTKATTPKSNLNISAKTKKYRGKDGSVTTETLKVKNGVPTLTRTVQGLEKGKKSTYVKVGDKQYYKGSDKKVVKLKEGFESKQSKKLREKSAKAYENKKALGNMGLATGSVQAVDEFWGIGGPGSKIASTGLRKIANAGVKLVGKRAEKRAKDAASKLLKEQAKVTFDNATKLTKDKLGREFAKNAFEKSTKDLAKNAASNTIKASKDKASKEISKKVFEKSTKDLAKNAVSRDLAKRSTKKTTELTKDEVGKEFAKRLAARKAKEAAKDASKKGTQKLLGPGTKKAADETAKKSLGEGVKSVAKTGSKALKPDKIIKPTTKALNSGKKITINVSGRTVSSGSQKALNSGQKLLNNGQTKLNAFGKGGVKKYNIGGAFASAISGNKLKDTMEKTGKVKKLTPGQGPGLDRDTSKNIAKSTPKKVATKSTQTSNGVKTLTASTSAGSKLKEAGQKMKSAGQKMKNQGAMLKAKGTAKPTSGLAGLKEGVKDVAKFLLTPTPGVGSLGKTASKGIVKTLSSKSKLLRKGGKK